MKKSFGLLVLSFFIPSVVFGITYDTTVDAGLVNPAFSQIWNHTITNTTGTPAGLIVTCFGDTSDRLTNPTVGTSTMSLIAKVQTPSDRYLYSWWLGNANSGLNVITATTTVGGAIAMKCVSSSFLGVSFSNPYVSTTTTRSSVFVLETFLTSVISGSFTYHSQKMSAAGGAAASTTIVSNTNGFLVDYNSSSTAPYSVKTSFTPVSNVGSIMFAIAPYVPPATTTATTTLTLVDPLSTMDKIFMWGIALFIFSFPFWGFIFSPLNKGKFITH